MSVSSWLAIRTRSSISTSHHCCDSFCSSGSGADALASGRLAREARFAALARVVEGASCARREGFASVVAASFPAPMAAVAVSTVKPDAADIVSSDLDLLWRRRDCSAGGKGSGSVLMGRFPGDVSRDPGADTLDCRDVDVATESVTEGMSPTSAISVDNASRMGASVTLEGGVGEEHARGTGTTMLVWFSCMSTLPLARATRCGSSGMCSSGTTGSDRAVGRARAPATTGRRESSSLGETDCDSVSHDASSSAAPASTSDWLNCRRPARRCRPPCCNGSLGATASPPIA